MVQDSNSLILRNSIYLYIRAIVSLILRLVTTRLVLQALGVEEYGVYQVIGGLVAMFGFLNGSLSEATIRFLAYEIGKEDKQQLNKVFSTAVIVHALFAFIVFVAIEIVGVLAVQSGYIKLGSVSVETALWILHFTAFSAVLTITSVPYNSIILAKEDMSYFAYIDLFGVLLSFILGCTLSLFQSDRLIYYGFLTFVISFIVRLAYYIVCHKKYPETRARLVWDKELLKKMTGFSAWTSFSSISYMVRNQGLTLIVNFFFGPILNSAVGVSNQVNQGVKTFSVNFQAAFSSQITKTYAQEKYERMSNLVISGAKLSTYLMLIFSIPMIIESSFILKTWLAEVPAHTDVIMILIVFESIIATMTCTGNAAIRANGRIKKYELCFNTVYLLSMPIMFIWLFLQKEFYIPFVLILLFVIVSTIIKLFFIANSIPGFNLKKYIYETFISVPVITVLSVVMPFLIHLCIDEGFVRFVASFLSFEMMFILFVYLFGLNEKEKELAVSKLNNVFGKWRKV